jgi:hypothetical protein
MSVKLEYPYDAITATVTLPNPSLGDSEQHQFQLQVKKDMSGNIHTNIRGTVKKKFLLTFPLVRATVVASLRTWYQAYAGQDVKFTDWNTPANVYRVKLLTNPLEATVINSDDDASVVIEMTE